MKRVLVTGGAGFVGANLARRLLHDGHHVHLILREQERAPHWRLRSIRADVDVHEGDLADRASMRRVLSAARPDWIFHCAAHGGYSWQDDLDRMIASNVVAASRLLDAAVEHGFESFVNLGSSSEYGYKTGAPAETDALDPNSTYAITKAFATHYCRHVAKTRGVNAVTLRLYSVFGPYEDPRRFIPTLLTHVLDGGLPALVAPEVARDFVHVDDVCQAAVQVARARDLPAGSVFNVGTGIQTTIGDVVACACKLFEVRCLPQWGTLPLRKWDTNAWVANVALIRSTVGWRAAVSVEDGLRSTAAWIAAHRDELLRI